MNRTVASLIAKKNSKNSHMISKECAVCTRGTLQFCSTLRTLNYRIIKNIFNQAYFDKQTSLKDRKENNLLFFIPLYTV
jgi:hypothetical protein